MASYGAGQYGTGTYANLSPAPTYVGLSGAGRVANTGRSVTVKRRRRVAGAGHVANTGWGRLFADRYALFYNSTTDGALYADVHARERIESLWDIGKLDIRADRSNFHAAGGDNVLVSWWRTVAPENRSFFFGTGSPNFLKFMVTEDGTFSTVHQFFQAIPESSARQQVRVTAENTGGDNFEIKFYRRVDTGLSLLVGSGWIQVGATQTATITGGIHSADGAWPYINAYHSSTDQLNPAGEWPGLSYQTAVFNNVTNAVSGVMLYVDHRAKNDLPDSTPNGITQTGVPVGTWILTDENAAWYLRPVPLSGSGHVANTGVSYVPNPDQSDGLLALWRPDGERRFVQQVPIVDEYGGELVGVAVDASGYVYSIKQFWDDAGGQFDLVKFDSLGNEIWSVPVASDGVQDYGEGIAVDASGNIYVTGETDGTFPGQTSSGNFDVFLAKYDASGNQTWVRQFGNSSGANGYSVAVDGSGDIYVTGNTGGTFPGQSSSGSGDVFLVKYDASGNQTWLRQFGTSGNDAGRGVAVDGSGDIYVTGYTAGTFPGQTSSGDFDVFLVKYDASGNQTWLRQFGTSGNDAGLSVTVDGSGDIYATGYTAGTFPGQTSSGGFDVFLVKYDASGNQTWLRQFGTSATDAGAGLSVAVDGSGNIYVTGDTLGAFPGQTASGSDDVFLVKYDASGNQTWLRQFGTSSQDRGSGVTVDGSGNIYLTGWTSGVFPRGLATLNVIRGLSGAGHVAGDGSGDVTVTAGGVVALAGSGHIANTGVGVGSRIRRVTGAGDVANMGRGPLDVIGYLAGYGSVAVTGSGGLGVVRRVAGVGQVANTGSGDLFNGVGLSGAGQVAVTGVGFIRIQGVELEGYRFRFDDGTETTATWEVAQDVNIISNNPRRLRVLVDTAGDEPLTSFGLQFRRVGDPDSEWESVST